MPGRLVFLLLAPFSCAWGQTGDARLHDEIQALYTRVDAAMARQDAAELGRLMAPDARLAVGPVHIALLPWLTGAMKQPGRMTSSEVTEVHLEGENAVASVRVHITSTSGGTRHQTLQTNRDTWVRRGEGWAWAESAALSSRSDTPLTSAEVARPVIGELKQRAHPLAEVQAGHGLDDLKPFGEAVGDARIVALGEATHGTSEFCTLKHRLLEYLVREKGFTVLAMEENWLDTRAVDRYIKTGEGGLPANLAPGFEEVRDMVEWMRAYNRTAPEGRLLTFTGFDMQSVPLAADAALAYLKRYAPDEGAEAEAAFAEARTLTADRSNVFLAGAAHAAGRTGEIVKRFDAHREAWVQASSQEAWRDARHAAALVMMACSERDEAKGVRYRDEMMARNVEWLADEEHPGEKVILWAHNGHVGFESSGADRRMGGWLRQRFGRQMYVAGFGFRRGEVRAVGLEKGVNKGYGVWPVPASPEGSGDAILSAAGMPLFFLDMSGLPREGSLAAWLAEPHLFHELGAVMEIGGEDSNLDRGVLSRDYDGLIFVENSHAVRLLER